MVGRRANIQCAWCFKGIYRTPAERRKRRHVFCCVRCKSLHIKANGHPYRKHERRGRKGTRVVIMVACPEEFADMAGSRGQIMEHRLVVAKRLGRSLTKDEVVHHIDGDSENNFDENLILFPCQQDHEDYERLQESPF